MLSFDSASPFRRHPWLYVLIILLSLGLGLLLVFGAWYGMQNHEKPRSLQPGGPVETPGERSNRIVIMNVLNTFHKDEGMVSKEDPLKDRQAAHEEHIKQVVEKLEAIKTEGAITSAQNDLLDVFRQWEGKVAAGSSGSELKPAFVSIAQKYPWLNTLVWIIILNRL